MLTYFVNLFVKGTRSSFLALKRILPSELQTHAQRHQSFHDA